MAERVLLLGGARSGKSAAAERVVAGYDRVVYVATGSPSDAEMAERIAGHRARRPEHWHTVETADLGTALAAAPPGAAVLIDDLTGWLADRCDARGLWPREDDEVAPLGEQGATAVQAVLADAAAFWDEAARHAGPVVLVADESGLGPVPADPATRRWLDLAGTVVQHLAAGADRVLLVVAGRGIDLPAPRCGPGAKPGGTARPSVPPVRLRHHGDAEVRDHDLLDFAVSCHRGPPSPRVRAALAAALEDPRPYPDDRPARAALARRHGRREQEVLPTAGAAEAFWLLAQAVRARNAVCVHPSFTEPEAALRAHGVPVTHVYRRAEDGWALRPASIADDADLVVVGNPNNPTGTLDSAEAVAALCRPGRVVLVDEAFIDFTPDEAESVAGRADLPGLIVTRSVTKLWGLAGIRAGYLLGPPGLVARCAALRQPWGVSCLALAALEAVASDEHHRRAVAASVAADRAAMAAELAALGLESWPSVANFLLVRVPDGPSVHAHLRARGIAVRPSTFPGLGPDHLRVAVRGDAERARLLDALRRVIEHDLVGDLT